MDCMPPSSSVDGILQARILECVAIPFSRATSQPRDQTQVSCIAGGFLTIWATREVHLYIWIYLYLFFQLYIYILFQILFHYRSLQDIEYSSLCYIVGLCWLSFFFNFYFWLHWVFVAVCGFCSCSEQGLLFFVVSEHLIVVASLIAEL